MATKSATPATADEQPLQNPASESKCSEQFGGSISAPECKKHSLQAPVPIQQSADTSLDGYETIPRRRSAGAADPVLESSKALRKISEALGTSFIFTYTFQQVEQRYATSAI
ncbi:unnamed protein product [Gongylonema pulchrum]|uniref:Uncharacterized protein n=1 Tax=Gongylonema pulchrum TaxID=637853 RepID=A0A183DDG0_9BILA|nr:unnamed protein product [Gongylonema pulchrum]